MLFTLFFLLKNIKGTPLTVIWYNVTQIKKQLLLNLFILDHTYKQIKYKKIKNYKYFLNLFISFLPPTSSVQQAKFVYSITLSGVACERITH